MSWGLPAKMDISILCPARAAEQAAGRDYWESHAVPVAGMCPFFLVAVRTSTVIFALAWVEWFTSELFNFWNTWHFWPLIHQPFGITWCGRLKYCFIPLQTLSALLVVGNTARGLPRGVLWQVSRWLSEAGTTRAAENGVENSTPVC